MTNIKRIARGIKEGAANAVLIELNQIGTLPRRSTPSRWPAKTGWRDGFPSERRDRGQLIADLTVAMGTGQLKTGAPCRGERVEKYNQLMRIEEELGASAVYAGWTAFVR